MDRRKRLLAGNGARIVLGARRKDRIDVVVKDITAQRRQFVAVFAGGFAVARLGAALFRILPKDGGARRCFRNRVLTFVDQPPTFLVLICAL